jgi:hypothetical protein
MAKIKNAKAKNSSGSYTRVFNNEELGNLITKVHSASISNGSELETLILQHIDKDSIVEDCDEFLHNFKKFNNAEFDIIRLIPKKILKKSKTLKPQKNPENKTFEPDFVVLKIDSIQQCCYIIELKDGFVFDTKKVIGERRHLEDFQNYIAKQIAFSTKIKFCCFNENSKEKIKNGLKGSFDVDEIMTGEEFCALVKIDYDNIIRLRKNDSVENIDYFIDELLKIANIKELIVEKLGNK